jgi:glucosamine-6-phosphate deaminase
MREHLFGKVNLSPQRSHLPNGMAPDPAAEAARYEAAIDAAGGIDLAVLGVGANGHVGFNEPAEALIGPTHVAELAVETWRRNFPDLAREGDPTGGGPFRRALTVGIGTILRARRILLLASGEEKRDVLSRGFSGPITTRLPVSLLQVHPDVTLVLDRAAAGAMRG